MTEKLMGDLGDTQYTIKAVGGVHLHRHKGRIPLDAIRHKRCHTYDCCSRPTCPHAFTAGLCPP
eukprot:4560349-Pleurochrysis_carterae.AAC.7